MLAQNETFLRTTARRLDGYRLYNSDDVPVPAEFQARARALRRGPRQFGRGRRPAQSDRCPAPLDGTAGRHAQRSPASGQDPASGHRVAAPARVRRGALYALGEALADTVIASHQRRLKRRPVRRITIDFDPTDDPTHGQQELAFFNGHYDTWCYLPLMGTLTFNDERIQYLVAAVLRPGTGPTARGAIGLLRRLFAKLRTAFPTARLRVRLDG